MFPGRPNPRRVRGALLAVACAAVALTGCGGGDDGGGARKASAVVPRDAASQTCRQFPTVEQGSCQSAWFACREDRAQIAYEADLRKTAGPRAVSRAYAKEYWGEWNARVQDAARTGCRVGLGG